MSGIYEQLNTWAESVGIGYRFDSLLDIGSFLLVFLALGWFAMHLIFD